MGTTYTKGASKADVRAEIISDLSSFEMLAHRTVGNHFWVALRRNDVSCVMLFLLSKLRGYGYGYKDISESSFPYYYDCPLSLLAMTEGTNPEWRAEVRAYHADKSRTYEDGDLVLNRRTPDRVYTVVGRRMRGNRYHVKYGDILYTSKTVDMSPAPESRM